MKIFLRHEHPGPKRGHHDKRGHKLFKKMAKLEKKLGKYHLAESGDESCSSAASEVRSRSRRRHRGRHQRARFASLGRCSSSSSSNSSSGDSESGSGTSASSSSDSSRSPSPGHHRHHRHHHHHGPPRHLSRSKSFAGRGCGSSPPLGPGHHNRHHHRHQPAHYRDHHHNGHWRRHAPHRHRGGICGLLYKALAQSEPNLPEAETLLGGESREEAAREPEVDGTSVQELDNVEASARFDETLEGLELGENLSESLKETLGKGLLADVKKSLLQKYPISKDCPQLRGSKLNQEFLSVASETAVKRDCVLQYEQSQIGTGLTALGRAINELNARAEAENSTEIIPILDAMGDAASIIADAHHNITQMRQAFLAAELNKRVRSVVDTCKADELLFGKDFADKVKDVRAFGKGKKGCEKKEKRKHTDQDGEKRKSKRLHRHGIVH